MASVEFTLIIPLSLPANERFSNGSAAAEFPLNHLRISVSNHDDVATFKIAPFRSEDEAAQFLPRIGGAFLWALVNSSTGLSFSLIPRPICFRDENRTQLLPRSAIPEGNDSRIFGTPPGAKAVITDYGLRHFAENTYGANWEATRDARFTAIIPNTFEMKGAQLGSVNAVVNRNIDNFVALVKEGVSFHKPEQVLQCKKPKLAFELYSNSYFEKSPSARILTLVAALESLLDDVPEVPAIQEMVDKLMLAVEKEGQTQPQARNDYNRLLARLRELKGRSIRQRFLALAENKLQHLSNDQVRAVRRDLDDVYTVRSKLLHTGYIAKEELDKASEMARKHTQSILCAVFRELAAEEPV